MCEVCQAVIGEIRNRAEREYPHDKWERGPRKAEEWVLVQKLAAKLLAMLDEPDKEG